MSKPANPLPPDDGPPLPTAAEGKALAPQEDKCLPGGDSSQADANEGTAVEPPPVAAPPVEIASAASLPADEKPSDQAAATPTPPLPPALPGEPTDEEDPILAPPTADWLAALHSARSQYGDAALRVAMSLALSISVHLFVLALMSVIVRLTYVEDAPVALVVGNSEFEERMIESIEIKPPDSNLRGETLNDSATIEPEETRSQLENHEIPEVPSPLEDASHDPMAASAMPSSELLPKLPWLTQLPLPNGGGVEGRDGETKTKLMAKYGGTPESETAVALALRWLVAHQRPDGSWRFDHTRGACNGRCGNPGTQASTTASTALALLPFLGAGHCSTRGEHAEVVQRGLYYLSGRMLDTPRGGDYQEGTMYAQGLAAIVLCEAYAMSGDPALKKPAQRALDFICYAQHSAGGWRYFPGQPGDLTVTGWQLMALKSGQLAKLEVPSPVIEKARKFLDSMSSYGGAKYGYLKAGDEPGPTAVGLLCRLYTGWPPDDERIQRGVEILARRGPQKDDLYFNYYATQVLHHAHSPEWPNWNRNLREHLIATQCRSGHEEGSWYFADPHGLTGGRLYSTSFAAMILEVYYRHQPLYEERAVNEDF